MSAKTHHSLNMATPSEMSAQRLVTRFCWLRLLGCVCVCVCTCTCMSEEKKVVSSNALAEVVAKATVLSNRTSNNDGNALDCTVQYGSHQPCMLLSIQNVASATEFLI